MIVLGIIILAVLGLLALLIKAYNHYTYNGPKWRRPNYDAKYNPNDSFYW